MTRTAARRPLAILLALLAVSTLAAGCVQNATLRGAQAGAAAPEPLAAQWYAAALAADPGHDHRSLAQHAGASTPNFRLLGNDPLLLQARGNKSVPAYYCGDAATRADGTRLSLVNVFGNSVQYALVDVTNAASPRKVGELEIRGGRSYDAALTPDGRFVVLAFDTTARTPSDRVEASRALPAGPGALAWTDACTGAVTALSVPPVTRGIVLVDVSDPAAPAIADFDPTPNVNLHSVATATVDGRTYVIGSTVGFLQANSYFAIDEVLDTPAGARLVRDSTYAMPVDVIGTNVVVPVFNGHTDATVQKHPVDGRVYAYLSHWEGGVVTLDLTVPQAPVTVAFWRPPNTASGTGVQTTRTNDCYPGAIHDVLPAPETWDGRHYILAGQECPYKGTTREPGGRVFLIDNTDPAKPLTVGEWHLPADTGVWTVEYQASPHYIALWGRTLFVSMYHAGLWAVDLSSSANLARPPSIGVYVPALAGVKPMGTSNDAAPFVLQVDAFADGTIILAESRSGIHVLSFDPENPAPPALPFAYP